MTRRKTGRAAATPRRGRTRTLLTRRELAERHGVHPGTITKWERDGMPVAVRRTRGLCSLFDPAAVDAWLSRKERAKVRVDGEVVSLEVERARKERAQAALAEQTYETRAGQLLPAADVERVWSAHVAAVRSKLLNVPITLADKVHRVATLEGAAGVERVLNEAMRDVLRELARGDDQPRPAATGRNKRRHR